MEHPPVTAADLDVCVCGDYRRSHVDGTGRCKLGELCWPGRCQEFLFFRHANAAERSAAERIRTNSPDVMEIDRGAI